MGPTFSFCAKTQNVFKLGHGNQNSSGHDGTTGLDSTRGIGRRWNKGHPGRVPKFLLKGHSFRLVDLFLS